MHHIKVIKDGNVNNVVKEQLVDGVQYVDNEPHEGSLNGITSGAVAKVAEQITTAEGDIDSIEEKIPSGASSSNKLVTESDLEAAQDSWQSGFTPKGEATVSQIDALTTQSNGDQYIVTDSGTITAGSVAVVAGDTVAWDSENEVWYKVNQYAKASEQAALTTYAQNVAHSIASEFDPTKPNDEGGFAYYAGTPVMYNGSCYVFTSNKTSGAWDFSVVEQKPLSEAIQLEGVGEAVNEWLEANPEATTTVQDGSLSEQKFTDTLKKKTIKDYVTPEMFGASGDGVTDDTEAFEAAIATQEEVRLKGTYLISHALDIPLGTRLIGFNNAQIRISTDSACILNITGNKVNLRGFGVYANGHSVDCGIVCNVESSRFLFEKVIVDHCTSGIKMRSYLTKLIGCEVSYFTENGFEFIGVSSEEYNSNTSIVLINCYARKDTNVRAKIGYKLTDVIYCSLISCACDHCEVAYEMQRCQSIAMLGCGCENVSDSAVKLREICRGITINSLFAGLNNAHSIVRCYGTNYLSVGECYWNITGTLDYVFYSGGTVVATLPNIWRPHNIYVYKTSKVSFANKVTYEPDSTPTKVYDGDMYTKDGRIFFADKNTSSNNYEFRWQELDKAATQLSSGFSGKNRVVFALAEIVDGSVLNFTDGKLLFFNASGSANLMAEINFGFVRNGTSTTSGRFFCYGSYQEIEGTVTLDSTEQVSDYVGFRPVAFTGYNSKKYVGIEFYCGNLTNPQCFIKADISRGISPYLIEWYDQSTHTVKNSTVAQSIVTLPNKIPMIVDRAKRDINGNEIKAPSNYPATGTYTLKIVDGVVQWVQDT